jgi:hypothetical protein
MKLLWQHSRLNLDLPETLMRSAFLFLLLATGPAVSLPAAALQASTADAAPLDLSFTVTSDTQVPGTVLKTGKHIIAVKDHLSDRVILQVSNKDGKLEATFLGVTNADIHSSGAGPVTFQTEKGKEALRGFAFPGGRTIEFVYPKVEAAALATKQSEQVLAIDPASDNLSSKGDALSRQDAQIVTLWSLQQTRVSSNEKGISAKKWVASPAGEAPAAPTVASAEPAPQSPPAKRAAPAPQTQQASRRTPTIKSLPHTASNMPLLFFVSLSCLACAFGLRASRSLSRDH